MDKDESLKRLQGKYEHKDEDIISYIIISGENIEVDGMDTSQIKWKEDSKKWVLPSGLIDIQFQIINNGQLEILYPRGVFPMHKFFYSRIS